MVQGNSFPARPEDIQGVTDIRLAYCHGNSSLQHPIHRHPPGIRKNMAMRIYNGMVTEKVVQQFLPHPLVLYSIAMPGSIETASILFTTSDPVCSYYETIELDHVAEACVRYLIEAGAPCNASREAGLPD